MNKVKVALTLFTIAIIVGPFAYVVIAYRDNLAGLVIPPQFSDLGQSLGQGLGQSAGENPSSSLLNITGENVQIPQLVGDPQYDPKTGDFSMAVNATNPLTSAISVDQLSVQIQSKEDNRLVGNISIPQPINIQPGDSAVINVNGVIPQELYDQISSQNNGKIDLNNIVLKNLDVTVGGIQLHFDQIDPASIQSALGGL